MPGKHLEAQSEASVSTPDVDYHYSGVFDFVTLSGASAEWGQFQPRLAPSDSHSLAELAVESADGEQIVEVGWTVDAQLNGDKLPHLFVFHWVDGKGACYNGCGWEQVSRTRYPGMIVALTREPQQVIYRNFNSAWWVWYQSEWIGFFPNSLWTEFSSAGLVQWFGEVAGLPEPTTEMGDGLLPPEANAAFMSNLQVEDASGQSQSADFSSDSLTDPTAYQLSVTDAGFSFGGPGYGTNSDACATCASLLANCGVVDDGCGNTISCGTCVGPETCGGSGLVNVCVLPDGGMGGLPWEGGYVDGGVFTVADAGIPNAGMADAGPKGVATLSGSGCSSSGVGSPLVALALLFGFTLRKRARAVR
jgi:hypothetical protein